LSSEHQTLFDTINTTVYGLN